MARRIDGRQIRLVCMPKLGPLRKAPGAKIQKQHASGGCFCDSHDSLKCKQGRLGRALVLERTNHCSYQNGTRPISHGLSVSTHDAGREDCA